MIPNDRTLYLESAKKLDRKNPLYRRLLLQCVKNYYRVMKKEQAMVAAMTQETKAL